MCWTSFMFSQSSYSRLLRTYPYWHVQRIVPLCDISKCGSSVTTLLELKFKLLAILLAIPHFLQCNDSLQDVAKLCQQVWCEPRHASSTCRDSLYCAAVFHIHLRVVVQQGRPFSVDKSGDVPGYLRVFLACLSVLYPTECNCNT